jgi:hypothetical protein
MRPLAGRVVVSAATAGLLLTPWMPARILGTLLVVGLLPGLAALGRPRLGDRTGPGIAMALSPHLFAAVVLLGMLAVNDAATAARLASGFWLMTFTIRGDWPIRARVPLAPALLSLCVVAAAALAWIGPALAGKGWLLRGDSWFNTAVTVRLVRDGLPLLDPYFSPLRLDAAYAYHALAGATSSLVRTGVPGATAILNLIALSGFGAALFVLIGLFAWRLWPRVLAMALGLFAANWLSVFAAASPIVLTLGPLCALLALMALARNGWWERRLAVAWSLVFPALLMMHVPLGLVALTLTLTALGFLHVIRAHPEAGGPEYATLIGLALAGAAASSPCLIAAMPEGGLPLRFRVSGPTGWIHLIMPILLATSFLRWQPRRDTPPPGEQEIVTGRLYAGFSLAAAGVLWSWVLGALVLSFFVGTTAGPLPIWLLFLPLVAFASGGIERIWNSRGGKALALVMVAAAIATPPGVTTLREAFTGADGLEISEHEQAVYGWIQRSAPADALFFEYEDAVWIPVLGARDQYWGERAARPTA